MQNFLDTSDLNRLQAQRRIRQKLVGATLGGLCLAVLWVLAMLASGLIARLAWEFIRIGWSVFGRL